MKKTLTFGEILIRLQTKSNSFFKKNANELIAYPGGSEANVAVSLAQFGINPSFFTAIPPNNALAKEALDQISDYGVDTSKVIWEGDRIGNYILLSADGLTKGEVIYDRKYSSFSNLKSDQLDYDKIFENISWLHWTALTPGLNLQMANLMNDVMIEASKRNIIVSVDLNYRSKLWQYGMRPDEIMPDLIQYCDVIMGNIWAANTFLNTPLSADLNRSTTKENYFEESILSAEYIFRNFPRCIHIANTFRFMDNDKHNLLYGTYHTPKDNYISDSFETNSLIDRIGSGDAFMAGLIYAIQKERSGQDIVNIATKAGFEKLFVEGDFGNGKF